MSMLLGKSRFEEMQNKQINPRSTSKQTFKKLNVSSLFKSVGWKQSSKSTYEEDIKHLAVQNKWGIKDSMLSSGFIRFTFGELAIHYIIKHAVHWCFKCVRFGYQILCLCPCLFFVCTAELLLGYVMNIPLTVISFDECITTNWQTITPLHLENLLRGCTHWVGKMNSNKSQQCVLIYTNKQPCNIILILCEKDSTKKEAKTESMLVYHMLSGNRQCSSSFPRGVI